MSEADSENVASQLENARATRERHAATLKKMKEMASHRTSSAIFDDCYSFPSVYGTSASSAEVVSMEQSPGVAPFVPFETSFFQHQQHEVGTPTAIPSFPSSPNEWSNHNADVDAIKDGGETTGNGSLTNDDTSLETYGSKSSDPSTPAYVDAKDEHTASTGPSADTESFASCTNMSIGGTDASTIINNISRITHQSLLDTERNRPDEDEEVYEKDDAIQCVYSSFGQTVGEFFEFCVMGEVIPHKKKKVGSPKKKSNVSKARTTPCRENRETETQNVPPYSDSQRKVVEERFGPASPGSDSQKMVEQMIVEEMFGPASSGSHSEKEEASSSDSGVGADVLKDESSHQCMPSLNAPQQQTSKAIFAPDLSESRSSSDKEEISTSGDLEYDSSPCDVPLTLSKSSGSSDSDEISASGGLAFDSFPCSVPLTPNPSDECHASTEESGGVIASSMRSTDSSVPKPQWKAIKPVWSPILTTPFGDASPNILTRRQRSNIAKQMQMRRCGDKSKVPTVSPLNCREEPPPAYDPPASVAAKGASLLVVPKDASPPPQLHNRPQWEHLSAVSSDEIANNAKQDITGDMSASSLALDVSVIECTNSNDEKEPRSVSISTRPVKIVSDMVPETPHTAKTSLTASQKSSGKWISPSVSTSIEPPLTKAAPKKSHAALSEGNFEPGTARKQLFGALDIVTAKEVSPSLVPKYSSPRPVHKGPQWEHLSAFSSNEIANNVDRDMSVSSLALDASAIKCTNSNHETEPLSVSTSVKIISDVVPETPHTAKTSLTASQNSSGKWISPSVSTSIKPPLTKAAPKKSHAALSEWNFEPGTARKQLFGALDNVTAKEVSPSLVPKYSSPRPVHIGPQWEHLSAFSSNENANNAEQDKTGDMSASSLALDVSAIECTDSNDETEPGSVSISTSSVKILSDVVPEAPHTAKTSLTASQKSSGKWISPSASTCVEPPITKSAPKKSHTERNFEPESARKQLFGALDQPNEMPKSSHATGVPETRLNAFRTPSLIFESTTEATRATPGIFKSQPTHDETYTTHDETYTTEGDSRILDFDLSHDWEMFPNEFVEPSLF